MATGFLISHISLVDLIMGMVIDNKFGFGETVYLRTDREQSPRIVFCIKVYPSGTLYEIACGTVVSTHYDFELSTEVNTTLQVT